MRTALRKAHELGALRVGFSTASTEEQFCAVMWNYLHLHRWAGKRTESFMRSAMLGVLVAFGCSSLAISTGLAQQQQVGPAAKQAAPGAVAPSAAAAPALPAAAANNRATISGAAGGSGAAPGMAAPSAGVVDTKATASSVAKGQQP